MLTYVLRHSMQQTRKGLPLWVGVFLPLFVYEPIAGQAPISPDWWLVVASINHDTSFMILLLLQVASRLHSELMKRLHRAPLHVFIHP